MKNQNRSPTKAQAMKDIEAQLDAEDEAAELEDENNKDMTDEEKARRRAARA